MTREDAIKILQGERWYMSRYSEEYKEAYNMAIEALQDRPTGKWIIKHGKYCGVLIKEYFCDQCGERGGLSRMLFDPEPLPNFCGHCGADMRGGEE